MGNEWKAPNAVQQPHTHIMTTTTELGTPTDEALLADQISKQIIANLEAYVSDHLNKYKKYTLSVATSPEDDVSTSLFFSLISSLKNVSILGRKLLEAASQYNILKLDSQDTVSIDSYQSISTIGKNARADDATSDDLLAALIESSPSDDFLVLSSSLESITVRDMILTALVYIKSHECFTLSHDINGVVMVLRRVKFLIHSILAPKNQMELVTKLLTSIGRYREMNYVLDLFKERNQFEVLLSKGVEKTPELRIALFNYVKKNPEFYQLVTLNFSMFSEIADSLEASAMKRLDKITNVKKIQGVLKSSSSSSDEVAKKSVAHFYSEEGLESCLMELVDASDCYAKAGFYKKSNNCKCFAKLVALQLVYLKEKNLLNLAPGEIDEVVVGFVLFEEAYIVAEAYNYHIAWRNAIFKNVILEGRVEYLEEFCCKCKLSSTTIKELVLLYKKHLSSHQLSKLDSDILARSMKLILSKLSNIEIRYNIYTQLNFNDSKEELMRNPAVKAHLTDYLLL